MIEKFILDEFLFKSLTQAKEREEKSLRKEAFLSPLSQKENPFEEGREKDSFLKGKEKKIKEEFKMFFKEEILKNAKR